MVFITMLSVPLRAQDRPVITRADVRVSGPRIVADLTCSDLFSKQIVNTVESGLPAVVELLYTLLNEKEKTVRKGMHSYHLQYDVWEDRYMLDRGDSVQVFYTFSDMGHAIEHLSDIAIVAVKDVNANAHYMVEFSITVHPLQGAEQEQMVGWVDDTVRRNEGDSWREHVLNINGLINQFLKRDKIPSNQSEWFRAGPFQPQTLVSKRGDRR
jgi:hypothetical protein